MRVLRSSTLKAQGELLLAAHRNSVQLVSRTLALQSELDSQEDHDSAVLQLYLQLERERLPQLLQELTVATAGCDAESKQRVSGRGRQAATRDACALDADARQALQGRRRFRSRSKELAAEVSTLARTDRQRLRSADRQLRWSDAELDAPLNALLRSLRRPNATFALPPEILREWEKAAELIEREGGADAGLRTTMLRLANTAPVRQEALKKLKGASDMGAAFVGLLQRARLHNHAPELVRELERWHRHEAPIWDVIELVEKLRSQHVFPLSMLHLHEEEWHQMVGDVAEQAESEQPISMDADQ